MLLGAMHKEQVYGYGNLLRLLLFRWNERVALARQQQPRLTPMLPELVFIPPYVWTLAQFPVHDLDWICQRTPQLQKALASGLEGVGHLRKQAFAALSNAHNASLVMNIMCRSWKRPKCRVRQRVALLHKTLADDTGSKLPRLRQLFRERAPNIRQSVIAVVDAAVNDHRILTYGSVNAVANYLDLDLSAEYEGPMPCSPLDPFLIGLMAEGRTSTLGWESTLDAYWHLLSSIVFFN